MLVRSMVTSGTVFAKIVGTSSTAYFELTRPVASGEEILTFYGPDYARDYPSPFGPPPSHPGRSARPRFFLKTS